MGNVYLRKPVFSLVLSVLLAAPAAAQEYTSRTVQPSTRAYELAVSPAIDGRILDDGAWEGVEPASGFWQVRPDEGRPATQRTEVYMGYTDEALYVAVMAYDDNPEGIIVADSRRDSSLTETDSFQVIIDGLLDRQNGFVFGTNPAGIEYDAQVINEGGGGGFGGRGGGSGGFNLNWTPPGKWPPPLPTTAGARRWKFRSRPCAMAAPMFRPGA